MASVRRAGRRVRYALDFPRLDGGLDLRETEERMGVDESPEVENLWWEDGVLRSRPGQELVAGVPSGAGTGYAAGTFLGRILLHIGTKLYVLDLDDGIRDQDGLVLPREKYDGLPENRGTFFRFGDRAFYKARGAFLQIAWDDDARDLAVSDVADHAFVPTVLLNADPADGSGDLYQPENRLSGRKRAKYTVSSTPSTVVREGDGSSRAFLLGTTAADGLRSLDRVYVGGDLTASDLYTFDPQTGTVLFHAAPPAETVLTFVLGMGQEEYHLPVQNVDAVEEVRVDGVLMEEGDDYTVDLAAGTVTFTDPPPAHDPPVPDSVEILWRKDDPDAFAAVMECPYAAVCAAGGVQLCVVLGGGPDHPEVVFWSGNTDAGLDPSYWPVPYYGPVGGGGGGVTGFGQQYGQTIVFQSGGLAKLGWDVVELEGRKSISLTFQTIHSRIGCDLPWTIQLAGDHLVFCHSGSGGHPGGVFRLCGSSPAYENDVRSLSWKIDGTTVRPGLLRDLASLGPSLAAGSSAADAARIRQDAPVSAIDDGRHYFLSVGGRVWVWDRSVSTADDPTWWRFTGIRPAAWILSGGKVLHLDASGRVTRLGRTLSDYGEGIRKVYQFPTRHLGSLDRLKDVTDALFVLQGDAPARIRLTYQTDQEEREDPTPLSCPGRDRLSERDLSSRDLSVPRWGPILRRRPMCRHVRCFAMRLESDAPGEDLAVVSARIQYRLLGKDR